MSFTGTNLAKGVTIEFLACVGILSPHNGLSSILYPALTQRAEV